MNMDKDITIGDKYYPAIAITDEFDAGRYFERCVQHDMEHWGKTREEAEEMERQNLGYFAGYFDNETRARVERLFRCKHPVFGAIAENGPPTPEAALAAGAEIAVRA